MNLSPLWNSGRTILPLHPDWGRKLAKASNFASKCNDFTIFRLFRSFYRFDLFAFSIRFTVSIFLPFRSSPFRSILPFRSFPKDRKGKKDRNGKKIETVKDRNGKKDRIFTDSLIRASNLEAMQILQRCNCWVRIQVLFACFQQFSIKFTSI